jgi:hypothetical protein
MSWIPHPTITFDDYMMSDLARSAYDEWLRKNANK